MEDLKAALELEVSDGDEYESDSNLSSGNEKQLDVDPSLEVPFPVTEVDASPAERSLNSRGSGRSSERNDSITSESHSSNKSSGGSSLRADAEPFVPKWQQVEIEPQQTNDVQSSVPDVGPSPSGISETEVWQSINSPELKKDEPNNYHENLDAFEVDSSEIVTVVDYSSGEQDLEQLGEQTVDKSSDLVKRSVGVNCDITILAVEKLKKMYLHLNAFKLEVNFLKQERDCLERIVSNLKPNRPSGSSAIYLKEIQSLKEDNRKLVQQNSELSAKLTSKEEATVQDNSSNHHQISISELEHAKKYCLLEYQLSDCNDQIDAIHKSLSEAFADYVLAGDVFSGFNSRKDSLKSALKDIGKSFKLVGMDSTIDINEISIKASHIRQQIKVLRKQIFVAVCETAKESKAIGSGPATPNVQSFDLNKPAVTINQVESSNVQVGHTQRSDVVEKTEDEIDEESDFEDEDDDEEEDFVQVTFSKPRSKMPQPKQPLLSVLPKATVALPVSSSSQIDTTLAKPVALDNLAVSEPPDEKSSDVLNQSVSSMDSFETAVSKYPNAEFPPVPPLNNRTTASTPSADYVSSRSHSVSSSIAFDHSLSQNERPTVISDAGPGSANIKGDSTVAELAVSSADKIAPNQHKVPNSGSTMASRSQGSTHPPIDSKTATSGNQPKVSPSNAASSSEGGANKSNKDKIIGRLKERYYWKKDEDITRLIMYTAKKLASQKINLTEMRPDQFIEEAKKCAHELGF